MGGGGGAESWEVENHLGVVGRVGKASKFGAVHSGGGPAQARFRRVNTGLLTVLREASDHN